LRTPEAYYRLRPGTEVVPFDKDSVLFRSDSVALRLEGASAMFFADHVLPLLDGRHSANELAVALPGIDPHDLIEHLNALTNAGVLAHSPTAAAPGDPAVNAFVASLEGIGLDAARIAARLSEMRVVLFGLHGHGALTAELLVRLGVGQLLLADPYPARPGEMMEVMHREAKPSRQTIVRETLKAGSTRVDAAPDVPLDREAVLKLAQGADFVIGGFDRELPAANHWLNRAAHQLGKPALFGQVQGYRFFAGPLVLPGETACYMCWRMRHLACADNFDEAIAYEEQLDARRVPPADLTPSLPGLAAQLAGLIAVEFLKTSVAIGRAALTDTVIEFDALAPDWIRHPLLHRPDCPVCGKKKRWVPSQPGLSELGGQASSDILEAGGRLVSRHCGVVRTFHRVHKDIAEPEIPFVFRAELSNSRFLSEKNDAFVTASGKGLTLESARGSALGEALERYASGLWGEERVTRGRRGDLPGPSLDPRRLVLFRPEQYAHLKYKPYAEDSAIGWVPMRRLTDCAEIYVPALAVLMGYEVLEDEPFLFPITSNGLAAGPTLPHAILSGAYEVLERDAFLNVWFHRLPCQRFDPASHPDSQVRALVAAYTRRGVALELYHAPTDHSVSVFIGLGVQEDGEGPAIVVGLGANHDPAIAARGALLEVAQVRPSLAMRLRDRDTCELMERLIADPMTVTELTDHDLLYADRRRLASFDFLRGSEPRSFKEAGPSSVIGDSLHRLRALMAELSKQDTDLLYCNLTSVDIAPFGVSVVRCVIPDYQPMHFGSREWRLAAERLYDLPRRLGIRATRAAPEDINPDPHPLA